MLLDGYQEALQDGPHKEQVDARNELRLAYRTALLAASPVEQPAAAPIDDRGPPAVSDLPRFPTVLRKMWSGTEVQQWIDDNIKPLVQERHHDSHCGSNAAPSPADERAAPCNIASHPDECVSMTITQYAELQRASEMLDWLEHQIRQRGVQGVSFDWVPSVDGEPSGYRYMRRHFIAEPKKDSARRD